MKKVNLIPLAGAGQRFVNAGYSTPKPLIKINGIPMVIRAANSLPEADLWIFICRKQHIIKFNIQNILNDYFPTAIVLSVDDLTDGQVNTCLLAKDYINNDDQLTIGACDNDMNYAKENFHNEIKDYDALVWTFRNNPAVIEDPSMYGWVNVNDKGLAKSISCKNPLSSNPMNDYAISGTFSFQKAKYFFQSAENIIKKDLRINNEFYIDILIDNCIQKGLNIKSFEIKSYTCWGTPSEVENYLKNQN